MNILAKQNQNSGKSPEQTYVSPVVDVQITDESYILQAEMPGVAKEGLEITVAEGELVIAGHRKPLEVAGESLYTERRNHDFRRVYELDPSIDAGRISAKVEQGVLTVTLPKAEAVKPRRIELQ